MSWRAILCAVTDEVEPLEDQEYPEYFVLFDNYPAETEIHTDTQREEFSSKYLYRRTLIYPCR